MLLKKIFISVFAIFLGLFVLAAQTVKACSCGPTPNVLESYESSDQVVILKAVSIEKVSGDDQYFVDGVKSTKMVVEKAYKGTLKVGDEITFAQGGGADCIWTFNEKSIGDQFLFYLINPRDNSNIWVGFACGRSRGLKGAMADLKFLENIKDLIGKTRVSGNLVCWSNNCPNIFQRKVKFISENNTVYEAITDKNGFYDIYDLLAGIYVIEPELPLGWKVSNYWLQYSTTYLGKYNPYPREVFDPEEFPNYDPQKHFPIVLKDKKHAELNFHLKINNSIQGRILDPVGKPMKGVCVNAVSADATDFSYGSFDCTDKDGKFKITELYWKNYVLVINGDEKEISAKRPIEMLFYPGVNERSKATVINISEGKEVKLNDFSVPKLLETITITGKLYYSDGSLVKSHQNVQFVEDKKVGNYDPDPYDYTDDNGVFELKIFKGQSGKIRGQMIFGKHHLDSCPNLRNAVIEDNIGGSITAASQWIEIKADKDVKDLKITLPFRECKKP